MTSAIPTAFVTGATGYTGREVVRQLVARGVHTVAHIRPDSAVRDECSTEFRESGATVDTTPWDVDALARALRQYQPDVVFFLIGTTRARMKKSDDDVGYYAVDYGLFQLLIDVCSEADLRPKVVYLSAMGTGPSAKTAYYRARWKAEQALRNSGLPFVVARPAMITGPERRESRPLERLGGAMADVAAGALHLVGARRTAARWQSTTSQELAESLVDFAFDDDATDVVVESEDLKKYKN